MELRSYWQVVILFVRTDWEEVTITVEWMASSGVAGTSERITRDNLHF